MQKRDSMTRDAKCSIPRLISRSIVDAVVYPSLPMAITTTPGSVVVAARLQWWRMRYGWATEHKRIVSAGRSVCTDSSHTGSSLSHLSRRSAMTLGHIAGSVIPRRPARDSFGAYTSQRRFRRQPSRPASIGTPEHRCKCR